MKSGCTFTKRRPPVFKGSTSYVVNSISMTYGGPKEVEFVRIRIPAAYIIY